MTGEFLGDALQYDLADFGSNLAMPLMGAPSSGFGDPRDKGARQHMGWDIPGAAGSQLVAPGDMEYLTGGMGGRHLRPNDYWSHWRDRGTGLEYRFAHHGPLDYKPGQVIPRGEQWGTVGGVINNPHLHMAVYDPVAGRYVDWGQAAGLQKGQAMPGFEGASKIAAMTPGAPGEFLGDAEPGAFLGDDTPGAFMGDALPPEAGKSAPTVGLEPGMDPFAASITGGAKPESIFGPAPTEEKLTRPADQWRFEEFDKKFGGMRLDEGKLAEEAAKLRMPLWDAYKSNIFQFANEAISPLRGGLQGMMNKEELDRIVERRYGTGRFGPAGYGTETEGLPEPPKRYAGEELLTKPGQVFGTVASYFGPGKVAGAAVGAVAGGTRAGLAAAEAYPKLTNLGTRLMGNLLTFLPTDYARGLDQGGPEAARQALWQSPIIAAVFTAAGLPAGRIAQTIGAGAAGGLSAAIAGERDPAKIAESIATLAILHNLLSPPGLKEKPEEVVQRWATENNVTEPEMEAVREILKNELPIPEATTEAVVGGELKPEEIDRIQKERLGQKVAEELAGGVPQTRTQQQLQQQMADEAEVTFLGSGPFIPEAEKRRQLGPTWRSRMAETLEARLPGTSDPGMVRKLVEGWAGKGEFKGEEYKWSGLGPWLDSQKGKVSKQDVMDFLKGEGQVRVQEVWKGQAGNEHYNRFMRWAVEEQGLSPDEADYEWREREQFFNIYARKYPEVLSGYEEEPGGTKFGQYTLPGGQNYRELLLTLPPKAKPGLTDEAFEDLLYNLNRLRHQRDVQERPALQQAERNLADAEQLAMRAVGTPDFDRLSARQEEAYRAYETARAGMDRILADIGRLETQGREAAGPSEEEGFRAGHWDEPNVLAHVRLNDRIDADGKKMLFVEEVQSDWHQRGRREGYADEQTKRELERLKGKRRRILDEDKLIQEFALKRRDAEIAEQKARNEWFRVADTEDLSIKERNAHPLYGKWTLARDRFLDAKSAHEDRADRLTRFVDEEIARLEESGLGQGVPAAPFSKTWHEMAMKRVLRYAAENGYDRVGWTTGEQQAQRYDLSKQIERLVANQNPDGTWNLEVMDRTGEIHRFPEMQDVPAKKLPDVVGKDLADKIISKAGEEVPSDYDDYGQERPPGHLYHGLDLKIGGEGMKGFYDKMLPDFLNKYGKQWGARAGEAAIQGPWESGYEIRYEARLDKPYTVYDQHGKLLDSFKTEAEADKFANKYKQIPVHSLDVTPSMRKSVLTDGQYMFSGGPDTREWFRKKEQELAPIWRSRMGEHINAKLPASGTGEGLANTIEAWAKAGMFKPAELQFSGLIPWLREQKGRVTKENVDRFLREQGQVEVREVQKGRLPDQPPSRPGLPPFPGGTEAKFMGYLRLPPGGENYREFLLTVPGVPGGTADKFEVSIYKTGQRFPAPEYLFTRFDSKSAEEVQGIRDRFADEPGTRIDVKPAGRPLPAYEVPPSHAYGDPAADVNRFAHVFADDRIIDGKKYLTVWEMQSDWAAEGRRKGYAGPEAEAAKKELTRLRDERRQILYDDRTLREYATLRIEAESRMDSAQREWAEVSNRTPEAERRNHPSFQKWSLARDRYLDAKLRHEDRASSLTGSIDRQIAEIESKGIEGLTPQFPFSKNWHEVTLKKMLRKAAEEGYDGVAWATGDMVKERYDLSKRLSEIQYHKVGPDSYRVDFVGLDGMFIEELSKPAASLKDIEDLAGKDIASKISKGEGSAAVGKEKWRVNRGRADVVQYKDTRGVDTWAIKYEDGSADPGWISEEYARGEAGVQNELLEGIASRKSLTGNDLKIGGEWANRQYDEMMPQFLGKYGKQWGARPDDKMLIVRKDMGFDPVTGEDFPSDDRPIHTLPFTDSLKNSVLHEGQFLFGGGPDTTEWFKDYKNAGDVPVPTQWELKQAHEAMVREGMRPDVALATIATRLGRSIRDIQKLMDEDAPSTVATQAAIQGAMKGAEVMANPAARNIQEIADRLLGPGGVIKDGGTDVPPPFTLVGGEDVQPGIPHNLEKDITWVEKDWLSPNIVAGNRFSTTNNPINDFMSGDLKYFNNRLKYESWAGRLFKPFMDDVIASEKALQEKLGPTFARMEQIGTEAAAILAEVNALKNQLKRFDPKTDTAKNLQRRITELEKDYEKAASKPELAEIYKERGKILKELMKEYANIRIKMAAGGNEEAAKLLSPEEKVVADRLRQGYDRWKARLAAQGLRTIEDDYVNFVIHHSLSAKDPGAAAFAQNMWWYKKTKPNPALLTFISRQPGAQDWFPLAYQSLMAYIPSVERKLAFNPFLTKWAPQVNIWSAKGFPNASDWLANFIQRNFSAESKTGLDRALNTLVNIEYARTLGLNLSPPVLHLAKLLQTPAWHGPVVFAKGLYRFGKGVTQKAMDIQGPERRLLDTYVRLPQLVRAVEQAPGMEKMLKPEFWRRLPMSLTSLVEYYDNGVNLFANLERAIKAARKGMPGATDPYFLHQTNMDTLMRLNFRGYTMPAVISSSLGRAIGMYTGQPGKLGEGKIDLGWKSASGRRQIAREMIQRGESKGRIIRETIAGRRDDFGSPYINKAIRMFVAYGSLVAGGYLAGVDLWRHAFHAPGIIMSRETGEEIFAPGVTPPFQLFQEWAKGTPMEKYFEDVPVLGEAETIVGSIAAGTARHALDVPAINRILNIIHGEIPEKFQDNPYLYLANIPKWGWKEEYKEIKAYQQFKEAKQHPFREYYKKSPTQRFIEDTVDEIKREKKPKRGYTILPGD